ncbi:MAG: hypothetical protein A2018_00115 [Alphaproteobacteria bacterium GWF2_58_20]|nr:MAG: hypothetical protein A2018_00115 [Alphaproteobacteria bacterium GWF2_58_20]
MNIGKRNRNLPILPDEAVVFLRRRMAELWGGLVLLLGFGLLLALASYHPEDPSFNTASREPVHNLLGLFGAGLSDFLVQSFGLAATLLPVAVAVWGLRILRHQGVSYFTARLVLLMVALASAPIALARIPAPDFWPQPYFGGLMGGMLCNGMESLLPGMPWLFARILVILLSGLLAIFSFLPSLGYSWGEIGRAFAALGHLTEAVALVFGGGIYLAFRKCAPHEKPVMPQPVSAGVEPTFAKAPGPVVMDKAPRPRKARVRQSELDLPSESGDFRLPPTDILVPPDVKGRNEQADDTLKKNAQLLESVLRDFGVSGSIARVSPGPVVTLYELDPAPGTKASRVVGLADDIARSMSAISVRIAIIPGQTTIGIELPNARRETVNMREMLESDVVSSAHAALPLILGKDIGGRGVVVDLARMPHLLIAGTTGSGKSVAINTMILSLLYQLSPEKCRFIMVDPKMLELSAYDGIPHLLAPVVTDSKKAVVALKWTVREMEDRYRAMSKLGVRNIENYNTRLREARENGEVLLRKVQTGFDGETGKPVFDEQPLDLTELPYIVVIIDEFADLMLVAGNDIETAVQRLAQMARAAGIHIIMATQRPSVDVITGTIKANFASRISFRVTSRIDSRTVLNEQGAEQLLGQGDMLYMSPGSRLTRVHGPFVRDEEVAEVVAFLKAQGEPVYLDAVTDDPEEAGIPGLGDSDESDADESLYRQAVDLVMRDRKASASYIQRCLQIGYNRSARIIERMEREGLVGAANHVGRREILG